jgi:hypothetical protein
MASVQQIKGPAQQLPKYLRLLIPAVAAHICQPCKLKGHHTRDSSESLTTPKKMQAFIHDFGLLFDS